MRLAIHPRSGGFSDRWLDYCKEIGIAYGIVDGFGSDILSQLRGFDAFLWHFDHVESDDLLAAPMVLEAAESLGHVVFPDRPTRWHFDNKLAQKYLLESLNAPLARAEIFYTESSALDYLKTARLPLVAKLKAGSGSANVQLLRTEAQARKYC